MIFGKNRRCSVCARLSAAPLTNAFECRERASDFQRRFAEIPTSPQRHRGLYVSNVITSILGISQGVLNCVLYLFSFMRKCVTRFPSKVRAPFADRKLQNKRHNLFFFFRNSHPPQFSTPLPKSESDKSSATKEFT